MAVTGIPSHPKWFLVSTVWTILIFEATGCFSLSSLAALYHQFQHVFVGLWTGPTTEKRALLYKDLIKTKTTC